jgi:hypothetical protein
MLLSASVEIQARRVESFYSTEGVKIKKENTNQI